MSQILLQQLLRLQQFRSLNETFITQIKASELFVLRHFNHLSPPLLPEAPRTEYCNDEPACPSFAPSIATAPGCLVYEGQPYVRSNPPTPPFSKSDTQEQAVVGNRERLVNPAKTCLSTIMGKEAVALEFIVILQKSYRSKREYRSIMPVQGCQRILRKLYVIKRMGNQWPLELRRPRPVLMDA